MKQHSSLKRPGPHIPEQDTSALSIQTFDEALIESLQPNEIYDVNRWLYVPAEYTEYRYVLGTRGKRPLIVVGINPSTAAPDALDPTIGFGGAIALYNGFDSFMMFNRFTHRGDPPE